jgi:hypothetical protein
MNELSRAEQLSVIFGILAVTGCVLWALFRRLNMNPPSPDPWDDEVAADLETGNGTPLCHHCLAPHDLSVDFCSQCGAAVGLYTNYLPYPRLFSVGHTFRIGTNENFKRSFVTIGGFFFLSMSEYGIFFPVYWVMLILNLSRPRNPSPDSLVSPPPIPVNGSEGSTT